MGLPILDIVDVLGKVIERVIPDPDKRMELQLELAKLADAENARASAEMIAQSEVNKVEAGHRSVFVAGWRPAIGWVGAMSLFMYYPVQILWQLIEFGAVKLDVTDLLAIIGGLLGFGIQRSYDKVKGTANDVLPVFPPKAEVPAPDPTQYPPKKKGLKLKWPF